MIVKPLPLECIPLLGASGDYTHQGGGKLRIIPDMVTEVTLPKAHFPASLDARVATCFPWNLAIASSFLVGWRSPFGPAMVVAPYGVPPDTSPSSSNSWAAYG